MDLTICERWKIRDVQKAETSWFLDWVLREPEQVSRHLAAGFHAYLALQSVYGPGELRTAREYFGGLGAQTLMIQDGLRPQDHTVSDFSLDAYLHLRTSLHGRPVNVLRQDAYAEDSYTPAHLAALDFGDLTAWRLRPGERHRELLDRVMAGHPRAVVLTDIAGPRLHLHRERYGSVLGRPVPGYPDYLRALRDWVYDTYGYGLLRGYYHRWSAVLAFVPVSRLRSSALLPVPDILRGLELHS